MPAAVCEVKGTPPKGVLHANSCLKLKIRCHNKTMKIKPASCCNGCKLSPKGQSPERTFCLNFLINGILFALKVITSTEGAGNTFSLCLHSIKNTAITGLAATAG